MFKHSFNIVNGIFLKQPLAAIERAIGTLARELERKAKKQVTITKT